MAENKETYFWNSGGNLLNGTAPIYLKNGGYVSSVENATAIVMPKSGSLANLTVKLVSSTNGDASPGLGNFRKFTVRKNGVHTNVNVTITGTNVTGISTGGAKVHFNQFDVITLEHQSSANVTHDAIGVVCASLAI